MTEPSSFRWYFYGELLWYTATKKNIVIGKPQITL